MKKDKAFIAIYLGILFLLGSCVDMLNPPDDGGQVTAGKGRLTVQLAGAGRTMLPDGVFDKYVLRFEYGGAEGYSHEAVEWTGGVSVDLEQGNWTVHADVYVGETIVGTGSAAVEVSTGNVTPVTIKITGIKTGTGVKGTLKYTVNYPADDSGHSYTMPEGVPVYTAEEFFNGSGNASFILTGGRGTPETVELDAGVYVVYTFIEDTKQNTSVMRVSAAHIYGGKETSLDISVEADEFTMTIPITGTAAFSVPTGFTVTRRTVKAYQRNDLGDPPVEAVSVELDTEGEDEFTLWVSPAGGRSLSVRQELEVTDSGGRPQTLKGGEKGAAFSSSQTRSVNVGQITDTFYGVSTAGISNGTVTADPFAAMVGATITVTVTPDPGFVLKTGSVKYNDGGADCPLAGSGDTYTFVIPAGDVTVSAEFVSFVRYVREGGTGNGLSWKNASGDLQLMMDELEAFRGEGYTGPCIVKVGTGTYRPKYKPNTDGTIDLATPANDRDSAFILREGVEVRGGYPAAGGDEASRNPGANETILSGDFSGNDTVSGSGSSLSIIGNAENAYHVVLGVDIPPGSGTVLDGLTITGGNADAAANIPVGGGTFYQANGGGIYNVSCSPLLNNVTIKGNKASASGGGMYNDASSPRLTGVVISGNDGGAAGGGMFNMDSSPVLTGIEITGNKAIPGGDSFGGGMCNANSSPVLTNVTISGNATGENGGGIANMNSSPVLTNVTISGNSAGIYGGGMYNDNSSPTLANVTISENSAEWNGGGMHNDNSSPTLTDVIISDNSADIDGGGMWNRKDPYVPLPPSAPVLTRVTISGNTAGGDGGGIGNVDASAPVLTDVVITGNEAVGTGGGMYNDNSSPVLTNVIVSGNTATDSGGGMYNNAPSSPALINVAISGNKTINSLGGGMYNYKSSPVLINVTISGNSSKLWGGGMHNDTGSQPKIRNSIVWGNICTTDPPTSGIDNNNSSTSVISYSIVQGSTGSGITWSLIDATNGGGNAADPGTGASNSPFTGWKDPAAAPTVEGDYRLTTGSPAIGAGDNSLYPASADDTSVFPSGLSAGAKAAINAALAKDLGGGVRKQGAAIDMGAYEKE